MLSALGLATTPPPSADLRQPQVTPKDQLYTSSCTGQAWSQALRLAYLHAGIRCPDLSALFPYYGGRAEHDEERTDAGSYLRTVAKAVMRFGCADEAAWPFRAGDVNKTPPWKAWRNANDRRGLRGYFRITPGDVGDVRSAIASGHPVVGGWAINDAFTKWNGTGVIQAQRGPFVGAHAMAIVAYAADGTFTLMNSWGTDWGRAGYAVVTDSFIANGSDLWAVQVTP